MNTIAFAETDEEIAACFPVMAQLRPHLARDDFISRIRSQQAQGYMLAYLRDDVSIAAVAGMRIGGNLAWGRFLYVDDLVTDDARRSRGHGKALLEWVVAFARRNGCAQVHLDSGVQRTGAHRFYEREGMRLASFHFTKSTDPAG